MKDNEHSKMIQSNSILLEFECWTKYIEGFTRGLQATDKVNSSVVLDCVGEVLEGMQKLKKQTTELLLHCEAVLNQSIENTQDAELIEVQEIEEEENE